MRILVVNSNTTESVTDRIAAAARAAGHPEAAIRLANLVIATGLIA